MKKLFFLLMCFFSTIIYPQDDISVIKSEIVKGNFAIASEKIDLLLLNDSLEDNIRLELIFEKERMDRIRIDFKKNLDDILPYIKKFIPEVDNKIIAEWENENSLEYKIIDGQKKYFNNAHYNLFRINKDAKAKKEKIEGKKIDQLDEFISTDVPKAIELSDQRIPSIVKPVKMTLDYTVTLEADAVPEGEVIRCWLPYPREGHQRQQDIVLHSINSDNYIIAPNEFLQRTIYLEKKTEKGKPTIFNYKLSFIGYSEIFRISLQEIKPYKTESELYKKYTAEVYPHVVFTDGIKTLSKEIVGNEKNPYLIAKKIFTWISNNIPWASAREYSTIQNISDYCLTRRHGDCGIKTLLFTTLARYNGLPVKWQSGWMLHPVEINLHDWAEIYLEGFGWLPVDQSFGLSEFENEEEKYFYLGSIDSYRFIVNDAYSQNLYPSKIYPRSETIDFQRGELEWRGGNIYFDKWDYDMKVEYEELYK